MDKSDADLFNYLYMYLLENIRKRRRENQHEKKKPTTPITRRETTPNIKMYSIVMSVLMMQLLN